MADDEKYKVPLFDGSNYSNWKFRTQILLEEHDFFDLVCNELNTIIAELPPGTAPVQAPLLRKNDKKCKSLITQRISDGQLEYVKEKDTVYDMWKALSDNFERADVSSQLRLRKMLLTMRYDTTESMVLHFLKFDKLVRELKSSGTTLEEIDIVCHLLLTMPEEYNMVVTALESGQLTLSFVKTRLLDEEAKRSGNNTNAKSGSSSTVFSATANKRYGNRNANSVGNRNVDSNRNTKSNGNNSGHRMYRARFDHICHHWGIIGHKRSECRKLKYEKKGSETVNAAFDDDFDNNQKGFVFFANKSENNVSNMNWFLDSGSTEHLATKETKLINKLASPINIRVAKSGHVMTADEVGDLKMCTQVNKQINNILMTGILSVSGLECNLLSVRKLKMKGFSVIFKDGKGIVKRGNSVAAVAHRRDKLYELCIENITETANVCRVSEAARLWHHRLGHLSNSGMRKLVNMADGIDVKELEISSEFCEICVEGKQTRLPHQTERVRAKRPLERIHSDLCGPIDVVSFDGKKYLLTFIDDLL